MALPSLLALSLALTLNASGSRSPPAKPADAALPPDELGEAVKLGKKLFDETGTHPLTRAFVGNALSCASCHPDSGAHPTASTLLGAATAYPAWGPREQAVLTLEDRVLNCFMRSLNGTRPPVGSKPSIALTAYITWLSTGMPVRLNAEAPLGPHSFAKPAFVPSKVSVERGRKLYGERCAPCHGEDGQGDPPVWGPRSYNAGAGLAAVPKLAGWLRATMPPDAPLASDADAVDVAAYVNSQPRPDFVLRDHLPAGDRTGVYNSSVADEVDRAPTWPRRK
ncbi:c-type cytochrome [Anaeromyxobacter diazotrophicus]|uniref:Cytochrome c n=1 Tax=Anaeromyxobacter diazotrophicus TaxID=2590199 RepID=A0A7I9VKV1_9BACT|nr:c-type cytochrome [Anaeromyxobacter diazotrophicus]GEJ56760.1 cytochrome c [Anaeromyxobacter diazotrophicus]